MREKELRLGVVLTGGVSLALYMHGVSKELLKLARASRAFHTRTAQGEAPARYEDDGGGAGRLTDTEPVYFALLKALTPECDLRVIIDVIAGSSAGGVNGIMLARALAHDYNLEPHRDLWLEHADVLHLIDPDAAAGRWGKIYIAPIVNLLLRQGQLKVLAAEEETRSKLLQFLRSRWFQPPFSGRRFSTWLLDAAIAMERDSPQGRSLLPEGHALDLFVSVTDFYGHAGEIALHDPPAVRERDHRHVLHYHYARLPGEDEHSDFSNEALPGLVFAARATSCFPGAFPPAALAEIDALLARRKIAWPGRERFIETTLGARLLDGRDPARVHFIDGSVVNDKPFAAAIAAIGGRPAHREVSRRLIYVEPLPGRFEAHEDREEPGFFRALFASLAEIPRIEPIRDELMRVEQVNRQIRLVHQVLARARPLIVPFVEAILPEGSMTPSSAEVGAWRAQANEAAAEGAGYAFHGYARLKLVSVAGRLRRLMGALAWPEGRNGLTAEQGSAFRAALPELDLDERAQPDGAPDAAGLNGAEIDFLRTFDVDFRVRRLRFVIRRLNELYRVAARHAELKTRTGLIDEVKATLYGLLNDAKRRWEPAFHSACIGADLARAGAEPAAFAIALARIGEAMGLTRLDEAIDEVFSVMVLNFMPAELRRDLFTAYVGFAFFDVMSFPLVQWEDLDEFEEILIDRISPNDATAIRQGGAPAILKGTVLRNFGGFFNRTYRENDYLWGRLNAADRLVDIVLGAVRETDAVERVDAAVIKRALFDAILDAEEPYLRADGDLIAGIRAELAAQV